MRQRVVGWRWRDGAAVAGFVLFLAICVVLAGALTARPAGISEDPQPTAPFPTTSASATPAASPVAPVADCIVADQFAKNGLLTQAAQYYAAAVPTPVASASASASATAMPSPGDAVSCAVAGLGYVAEQKQHAAVLAAQGDAARSDGDEEAAKRFYKDALAADRANTAAAEGLQILGAQPATGFQTAQDRLQHTRATVLAPLGLLLLWVLAIAAGLYLLILLTKAASRVPWPLYPQQRWRQVLHAVAIVVTVLGGIALGVGAGLAWVHEVGWPWLVGLGVAAVLAVVSWSWYLRLRVVLHLDVNKVDGQADPEKVAFLAGRLVDMGSDRPRGIRMVQQTDVTSLPAAALSVLPGGNFLSAALQVLNATRTASPWQATVSMIDTDQVAVRVERYGKSVTNVVADRRELWFHNADPASICDIGDDGLLTIAAAVILCALAGAHDELNRGLAGATQWRSIAGQVLAGDVAPAHPEAQLPLLARAMDADPSNFAARVTYLRLAEGNATDVPGQREFAASMSRVDEDMRRADEDRRDRLRDEPVYLRVLFNRAVALLNALLYERAQGNEHGGAWPDAERSASALRERLKGEPKEPGWDPFWEEMRQRTEWLCLGVEATRPGAGHVGQAARAPRGSIRCEEETAWRPGVGSTTRQYYDCACTRAARRDYAATLDVLELAVLDPELKVYAQTDASFAELLDPDRVRDVGNARDPGRAHLPSAANVARFYKIIGRPGPDRFTALDPFAKYDEALRAAGVHTEHDLLRLTDHAGQRRLFAQELGVPEFVVQRWRDISELAARDPDPERKREQHLAYLEMLLARDVDSLAELRRTFGTLHQALLDHPLWRTTPPPASKTLADWAARCVSRAVSRLRAAADG